MSPSMSKEAERSLRPKPMTQDTDANDDSNENWGNEQCEWCKSLSNVAHGFVHDVSDESWTDYDALCRECFIEAATTNDNAEVRA
jgi:hypothetical protein